MQRGEGIRGGEGGMLSKFPSALNNTRRWKRLNTQHQMQEEIFLSRWNRTQVCGEGKGRDTLMLEAIFLSSLTLPTCRATTRWCVRLLQGGGGEGRERCYVANGCGVATEAI